MLNKSKKLFGFTLLELLFVIAIIGVMASLGISYMTKRTEDEKIKKAALQIQQLLEAGINYYADQNKWPANSSTVDIKKNACDQPKIQPPCEKSANPLKCELQQFCPYIPALEAMQYNPWGTDEKGYSWKFTETDPKKGNFTISTKTPGEKIASRTAALLPYGTVSGLTLSATVTRPVSTAAPPEGHVHGVLVQGYNIPYMFAEQLHEKEGDLPCGEIKPPSFPFCAIRHTQISQDFFCPNNDPFVFAVTSGFGATNSPFLFDLLSVQPIKIAPGKYNIDFTYGVAGQKGNTIYASVLFMVGCEI